MRSLLAILLRTAAVIIVMLFVVTVLVAMAVLRALYTDRQGRGTRALGARQSPDARIFHPAGCRR